MKRKCKRKFIAIVVKALIERNPQLNPIEIEEVIFGNANGAGEDNRNVARMSALLAGLPVEVGGTTLNRLCGSGLDAVNYAARAIAVGNGEYFCLLERLESNGQAARDEMTILVEPKFVSSDRSALQTELEGQLKQKIGEKINVNIVEPDSFCDLAIMADHAYIRQVGNSHGSVAAGGATQWCTSLVVKS